MDLTRHTTLFLGIDGGGSKCKGLLVNDTQEELGSAVSGPANPFHGFDVAMQSILDAAEGALQDAGLPSSYMSELVVGAGLAGVNLPSLFDRVSKWSHPFKAFYLATDLHIASLGAHGGNDGAVIITGTGSVGYSHIDNQDIVVGGHGFPHGDKGSGAWFGLQAVTHALAAMDNIAPPTVLVDGLLAHLQCATDLDIVERIADYTPADYGKLACLVFAAADQSDPVALAIVRDGADYINKLAAQLWQVNTSPLALIGGLTTNLQPYLDDKLVQQLVNAEHSPEYGAVLFAQKHHNMALSQAS